MLTLENSINIFTDGACSNNPGKGGAAAILKYKQHIKHMVVYLPLTTNNQMELIACIIALKALKKTSMVNIFTDSVYVKNGITQWIKGWQNNNWRTSNNKPIKNITLWQTLLEVTNKHKIKWHWIKGHNGHPENENADMLAKQAIRQESPLITEFLYLSYELGYKQQN